VGLGSLLTLMKLSRFRWTLLLFLMGQLGMHLFYGDETFLYSLHFAPFLVILAAFGTLTRARRLSLMLAGLLLLVAAMFREEVDRGDGWKKAVTRFEERLIDLERAESIEDAFLWVEDTVGKSSLTGDTATGGNRRGTRISDRLLSWLEENYSRRVTIADAADAVAASPSGITHKLKEETGKTFTQHLSAMRVSEAKRLLAYTDLSLTEISASCGFSDQSYFTKVFRQAVNMTPGEFRSMLDEKA